MSDLETYIEWLSAAKAEKELLLHQRTDLEERVVALQKLVDTYIKARWVLSEVTRITQENVRAYVENLTTMAIRSVFNTDCEFHVAFKISRNKSECFLSVREGGYAYVPKDEDGGGILDIISFALRVVLYSLESPRSRNVLIIDEPFKWTGKMMVAAGQMLKEISSKLGLQIILVTHEPELSEIADRSFLVEKIDGISRVTVVDEVTKESSGRLKRRKR